MKLYYFIGIPLLSLYTYCQPAICEYDHPPQRVEAKQSHEEVKDNSLAGMILNEYNTTKDSSKVRKAASNLENNISLKDAFSLYKALDDKEGMKRVAFSYFISEIFLDSAERMAKDAGLELNANVYSARGKFQLEHDYFEPAFEAYRKAGDKTGIRKCALIFEREYKLSDAFEAYELLNDKAKVNKIAEEIFVVSIDSFYGKRVLEQTGREATKDLWNKRAEYQLRTDDYSNAIEAYKEAGNKKALRSLLEKYTR